MDWIKIKRFIIIALLYRIYFIKHYWKIYFFNLFLFGIVYIIYNVLIGIFVQNVSSIKDYLLIVVIGIILTRSYSQSFGTIIRRFADLKRFTRTFIYSGFIFILASMFFQDISVILSILLGYFTIPLFLKIITPLSILYTLFFSLIIMFTSYSLGFILSPLFIYARKEARDLVWLLEDALKVIIPTYFLLSYFWFYKFTIFIPPTVLIEEFRNLLIYNKINLWILTQALTVSFFYFLIGYYLFRKFFDMARKKGWVKLK